MNEQTLRRVMVNAVGGPEQLILDTHAQAPQIGPGQVVVDVEAAGVNYLDVMQRKGMLPMPLPYTPGMEGVGRVLKVDTGTTLQVGQRVAWVNVRGSYASQLVLPAAQAIPVPDEFSLQQALLFQGLTAQYLAHEYRQVQPGDRVLVHAGSGGVGQLLIQWLKRLDAWVVATTSSDAKGAVARSAGADAVINYGNDYVFLEELLTLTGGRGVDLAFDSIGSATLASTVKGLARGGTAVMCGSSSGLPPAINPMDLIASCTRVAAGSVFSYIAESAELQQRAAVVIEGIRAGWLRMPEGHAFALDQATDAHRAMEGRGLHAKLYLKP